MNTESVRVFFSQALLLQISEFKLRFPRSHTYKNAALSLFLREAVIAFFGRM